ncbi:hypothetical protein ACGFJ7_35555 [Actinoplanes sp. NPDC048988]|uniref:hypothetical protein n=1 Tax=Actinoplanes sp. NPDC048988 TaxID=3363901 RepID=UPI00371C4F8E
MAGQLESAVDRLAELNEPSVPRLRPNPIPVRASTPSTGRHNPKRLAKAAGIALLAGFLLGMIVMGWFWWHHSSGAKEDRLACTGPSRPANFTVQRQVEVKVSGTPTHSPSPYVCETWYPEPIDRPEK